MILIREGVFETNSSSTHSSVICTKSNYQKWQTGEYAYCVEDTVSNYLTQNGYEEYLHDDFVDIKCFSFIKISDLITSEEPVIHADEFTLKDLWDIYKESDRYAGVKNWEDYEGTPLEEMLEELGCELGSFYSWQELLRWTFGLATMEGFSSGELSTDVTRKRLNGVDIVVHCEYGYD